MRKMRSEEHPQAHRLGYVLKGAQHALRLMMDQYLEPVGLTTPQYNVLAAVQAEPGISNATLARAAFVTAQSMLGIIANLEREGLLRREAHPTHGRIRQSELTQKGKEILESAHALLGGVEATMTAGFGKREVQSLDSLLRRCTENMRNVERT